MPRRSHQLPWTAAGRVSDSMISGDEVVRQTGWVFNNATGETLTLAEFVSTGDHEVPAYLETFGMRAPENEHRTLVEIGSGIGRMTCAFTREFGSVIACDLDAGFLERCHETVARFGKVERLRTVQVADGRTLDLADRSVDVAFSYITLQHCSHDDALALAAEAVRVVRPGGTVLLNFRGPSRSDVVLVPAGRLARAAFRLPGVGAWLTRRRSVTRFAWQVSRLHPDEVAATLRDRLAALAIWTNPASALSPHHGERHSFEGINPTHWWLVATVS